MASVDEARLAVARGASLIGLVSAMPSGPGPIPEEQIAEIAATVPPGVTSVLLTAHTDPAAIAEQQARCGVRAIQFVDRVEPDAMRDLREALPGIALIQVVHVAGEQSVAEAIHAAPLVDALLLDSGRPDLAIKELGGTGRVHDWQISHRIREAVDIPVLLAGGLRAENVREAIETVRPYAVDVCTGVRTNGLLDDDRLTQFMDAVEGSR
ncbi:MAG: phosphoribosylanthranilate isomerase [Gemmatimonadota bacterium]